MAWANLEKHTSTFTGQGKKGGTFFLLQENTFYLLQENGYRIRLQESMEWANPSKSSSVWVAETKH